MTSHTDLRVEGRGEVVVGSKDVGCSFFSLDLWLGSLYNFLPTTILLFPTVCLLQAVDYMSLLVTAKCIKLCYGCVHM